MSLLGGCSRNYIGAGVEETHCVRADGFPMFAEFLAASPGTVIVAKHRIP